jgi:hypothetical protein
MTSDPMDEIERREEWETQLRLQPDPVKSASLALALRDRRIAQLEAVLRNLQTVLHGND